MQLVFLIRMFYTRRVQVRDIYNHSYSNGDMSYLIRVYVNTITGICVYLNP